VKVNRIDAVLDGWLTRSGNVVRITVQLTSATTGQVLSGGRSYNGTSGDILSLESESRDRSPIRSGFR